MENLAPNLEEKSLESPFNNIYTSLYLLININKWHGLWV